MNSAIIYFYIWTEFLFEINSSLIGDLILRFVCNYRFVYTESSWRIVGKFDLIGGQCFSDQNELFEAICVPYRCNLAFDEL